MSRECLWTPMRSRRAKFGTNLRTARASHQIRDGETYPAILFTTGDNDTRVAPLHARKMAARMQAANSSGLPILLRYDLVAGHSGSGALSRRLDSQIDTLAFLYGQFGRNALDRSQDRYRRAAAGLPPTSPVLGALATRPALQTGLESSLVG